jgi:hypothetical protein
MPKARGGGDSRADDDEQILLLFRCRPECTHTTRRIYAMSSTCVPSALIFVIHQNRPVHPPAQPAGEKKKLPILPSSKTFFFWVRRVTIKMPTATRQRSVGTSQSRGESHSHRDACARGELLILRMEQRQLGCVERAAGFCGERRREETIHD